MKRVNALLAAMLLGITVLAACSKEPAEVPTDDAANAPETNVSAPATVPTTATVTDGTEATTTETATGETAE